MGRDIWFGRQQRYLLANPYQLRFILALSPLVDELVKQLVLEMGDGLVAGGALEPVDDYGDEFELVVEWLGEHLVGEVGKVE